MHTTEPTRRDVPRARAPASPATSTRTESVVLAVAGPGCQRAGERSGHTYRAALAAPASDLLPPAKGAR